VPNRYKRENGMENFLCSFIEESQRQRRERERGNKELLQNNETFVKVPIGNNIV